MTTRHQFTDIITTEDQLREIIGFPSQLVTSMKRTTLDELSRAYIAQSPFLLITSSDVQGNMDVSPKGDPPGFVTVLDDTTLLIPDRPGNRRADTFINILQNPKIGLLFLIPGKRETLRVSGQATIVRDAALREQMAVRGKVPNLLIAVRVEEVFFHCPKCIMRSKLWKAEGAAELDNVPSLAQAVVEYAGLEQSVEEVQTEMDSEMEQNLY